MTTLLPDRTSGRHSTLSVRAADGGARVRTTTTGDPAAPGLRPMLLDSGPDRARIALVPDGALLLAGDAIRLHIEVGPGMRLDLVEPGGTVAYDMRGGDATWDVQVDVAEAATVVWAGEPFVLAAGSRVRRTTAVRLGVGARLALRETLVLGRHRERSGHLSHTWSALGPDDAPLLVEELVVDETVHRPGILGAHRTLASVVALGLAVPEDVCPTGRMDLEHGGTLWRGLAEEAHRAVPTGAWQAVLDAC